MILLMKEEITLGDRLKLLRGKRTQEDVSKTLGLSRARYSHYENNRVEPDTEILNRMADYFNVSVDYLLGRTNQKESISKNNPLKLSDKDEKDIARRMKQMKKDLMEANPDGDGLNFMGEPMSEEAIESLLEALEHAERIATLANKKYTPNKYKNKE